MTKQISGPELEPKQISLLKVLVVCLGLIAGFVFIDLLFFANGQSFKREGGGLENASAVLYGIAVIAFFVFAPDKVWLRLFHVPGLMLLFAMRELDFDKAFTESGILSLRLYSGDASIMTKLIAGAIAGFSVYVLYRNVRCGVPAGWQALKSGLLWPWFALGAGGLVVGTKAIDGLGRKLLDIGISISTDLDATASLVEEVGEVLIPVCAIMAIAACWRGRRA